MSPAANPAPPPRTVSPMTHSDLSSRPAIDVIQPFQVEDAGVRGRLVRLGPALAAMLKPHAYPAPVATLLAETVTLAAVLASALKYDGIFTLQTQSDGPVGLMVADLTSGGDLRGYARFDEGRVAAAARGDDGAIVPRLLGNGHLAFTVDQGPHTQRYQGITPLEGATIQECAQTYFRQSEQLETAIVLAADIGGGDGGARSGALMVQRLPPDRRLDDKAEDDWRRTVILMSGLGGAELLDAAATPSEILYRLYHEDGVRLYRARPVRHACRCSEKKVTRALRSFPKSEIAAMAVDGVVDVTCEFCGVHYRFDEAGLDRMYGA
jgi:molecular chaperone Hsp33